MKLLLATRCHVNIHDGFGGTALIELLRVFFIREKNLTGTQRKNWKKTVSQYNVNLNLEKEKVKLESARLTRFTQRLALFDVFEELLSNLPF